MNKAEIELIIMKLKSEIEEIYYTKECKDNVVKNGVIASLDENLKENKISSTDYQIALDILNN